MRSVGRTTHDDIVHMEDEIVKAIAEPQSKIAADEFAKRCFLIPAKWDSSTPPALNLCLATDNTDGHG